MLSKIYKAISSREEFLVGLIYWPLHDLIYLHISTDNDGMMAMVMLRIMIMMLWMMTMMMMMTITMWMPIGFHWESGQRPIVCATTPLSVIYCHTTAPYNEAYIKQQQHKKHTSLDISWRTTALYNEAYLEQQQPQQRQHMKIKSFNK